MLNRELPRDSAIPCLGTYPRVMKTFVPHRNLYMNVHGSIIHNGRKQKQPKCLSIDWRHKHNVVRPRKWNLVCQEKGRTSWYVLQHEWTLGTWCRAKETHRKDHGLYDAIIWNTQDRRVYVGSRLVSAQGGWGRNHDGRGEPLSACDGGGVFWRVTKCSELTEMMAARLHE